MLEILKYTLPALIVLLGTWLVLHFSYKNEDKKRFFELKKFSQKEITSIRLRAYERLCLLLERTQPEHLLMDVEFTAMTPQELQQYLLRTIRLEFDHNMSQQVYISDETWDKIIVARDEMAAFISSMALQMPPEGTVMDYAKILMTAYHNNGDTPHQLALAALKDEARRVIG